MLHKGTTQWRRLQSVVWLALLRDFRIVIFDMLCVDDMVGKSTQRCDIQPDRPQVTLSVMIRAKYKHVARRIWTIVGMPEGLDVMGFRVRQAFPERDSKIANLTMVMIASLERSRRGCIPNESLQNRLPSLGIRCIVDVAGNWIC